MPKLAPESRKIAETAIEIAQQIGYLHAAKHAANLPVEWAEDYENSKIRTAHIIQAAETFETIVEGDWISFDWLECSQQVGTDLFEMFGGKYLNSSLGVCDFCLLSLLTDRTAAKEIL